MSDSYTHSACASVSVHALNQQCLGQVLKRKMEVWSTERCAHRNKKISDGKAKIHDDEDIEAQIVCEAGVNARGACAIFSSCIPCRATGL